MTYRANEYREPVTFDDLLISGNTSRTLSSATTLSGHITEGSMLQTWDISPGTDRHSDGGGLEWEIKTAPSFHNQR